MSISPLALVPLRSPGVGKSRLAPPLQPPQRASLAAAMLTDVVAALHAGGIERVVVAAAGTRAATTAGRLGVEVLPDPPDATHLDVVVEHAARVLGLGHDLVVVAGDLPTLRGAEVATLVACDAEVVLAPTTGGGTGALLRRPADRIGCAYGPGSAQRHHDRAIAAGASVRWCHLDGFAHDVDTWTDLAALHELELGAATAAVLPELLGAPAVG